MITEIESLEDELMQDDNGRPRYCFYNVVYAVLILQAEARECDRIHPGRGYSPQTVDEYLFQMTRRFPFNPKRKLLKRAIKFVAKNYVRFSKVTP